MPTKTLAGFPSKTSDSHFITTFCFSVEKTFRIVSRVFFGRYVLFELDPSVNRIAPSFALSRNACSFYKGQNVAVYYESARLRTVKIYVGKRIAFGFNL